MTAPEVTAGPRRAPPDALVVTSGFGLEACEAVGALTPGRSGAGRMREVGPSGLKAWRQRDVSLALGAEPVPIDLRAAERYDRYPS